MEVKQFFSDYYEARLLDLEYYIEQTGKTDACFHRIYVTKKSEIETESQCYSRTTHPKKGIRLCYDDDSGGEGFTRIELWWDSEVNTYTVTFNSLHSTFKLECDRSSVFKTFQPAILYFLMHTFGAVLSI